MCVREYVYETKLLSLFCSIRTYEQIEQLPDIPVDATPATAITRSLPEKKSVDDSSMLIVGEIYVPFNPIESFDRGTLKIMLFVRSTRGRVGSYRVNEIYYII